MKVIGIVCSPRLRGNTEAAIAAALEGAKDAGSEVELLVLAGKTMAPCDACRSCWETGRCHQDDDMQAVYPKLLEADGIILGSPAYFLDVSAQAKILVDRTYAFIKERKLRGKVGGIVAVARRSGCTNVVSSFQHFFALHRMIGAGNAVAYEGKEFPYADKGAIRNDERALKDARSVGKSVVQMIRMCNNQVGK